MQSGWRIEIKNTELAEQFYAFGEFRQNASTAMHDAPVKSASSQSIVCLSSNVVNLILPPNSELLHDCCSNVTKANGNGLNR